MGGKGRVLQRGFDENRERVLHLLRLELDLLRHILDDPRGDEGGHVVHVGPTLSGTNPVDERNLFHAIFGRADTHRPTIRRHGSDLFHAFVHLGVRLEGGLGERFAVQSHLTVGGGTYVRIPNPFLENLIDRIGHSRHRAETFPIGFERDRNR